MFDLRQSIAKKKVVRAPPKINDHHSQFFAIPPCETNSETARGVSAAKVVATIDKPAIYHGKFLPPKKKSDMLFPAFFL